MKDILKTIESFEGIIGALLGVIITLILTQVLKNWGGIKTYVLEWKVDFFKPDGYGGRDTSFIDEASSASLYLNIEIYNGSEMPKILRDIKFSFYNEKLFLFSVNPNDESTARISAGARRSDPLLNINIPPKQIVTYELSNYLSGHNLELFKEATTASIEMREHNNKLIKFKLF
ncbi:hypothetical protein [Fictibacillus sp. JL2B1089]|uniref:hypothetical protein n=1 Tax=Fictibacillus sp. JL2B1089 TaxID=3399565 RepID=UPI003A8850CD